MPDSPKLTDVVPTDALKDAGQKLLGLMVQRAAEAATDRVAGLTDRLNGVAENGGTGLRDALRSRSDDDDATTTIATTRRATATRTAAAASSPS